MKVAILSQDASIYSTKRLTEACLQRGHEVQVVDFLRCTLLLHHHHAQVWHKGSPCPHFDVVIPRIGPAKALYGIAVVRQFEVLGIPALNSAAAITCARDKLHCYQRLALAGLPLPSTGFTYSSRDMETIFAAMPSQSVVMKVLQGSHGIGVVLAETLLAAKAMFEAFRGVEADVLVQACIEESRGMDLRCFVIGDRVAAAIQRKGLPGEFRANLHRGGIAQPVQVTPQEQAIAIRAAQAIGLQVAGVDLLRTHQGPVVIEVNASPGLEGIEKATQTDLASEVICFLEQFNTQ